MSSTVKNPIEANVLLTEASLARKQRKSHATFIPLMVSEMPQAGDLVGLDAEFVTLNQVSGKHSRFGFDTKKLPSHKHCARSWHVHRCILRVYGQTGRGGASKRWHQVHHKAEPDVCGSYYLCEGTGAQRGGSFYR